MVGQVDVVLLASRPGPLAFSPPQTITSTPFDPFDPTKETVRGGKHGAWWIGDYQGPTAASPTFSRCTCCRSRCGRRGGDIREVPLDLPIHELALAGAESTNEVVQLHEIPLTRPDRHVIPVAEQDRPVRRTHQVVAVGVAVDQPGWTGELQLGPLATQLGDSIQQPRPAI